MILSPTVPIALVGLYGVGAAISCVVGLYQTSFKRNPFGLTRFLFPYGSFVWGDAVVLGFFWAICSLLVFLNQDFEIFLRVHAIFWIVRSAGEIGYWLLQQFSTTKRDLPESLVFHRLFPGESIWFVHQLFWQVVLVISITGLIYLVY